MQYSFRYSLQRKFKTIRLGYMWRTNNKELAKVNKNLPSFEEFIEKSLISQENNK